MDKPLGKSSGEITIDVHLNGLDEQLAKAYELVYDTDGYTINI